MYGIPLHGKCNYISTSSLGGKTSLFMCEISNFFLLCSIPYMYCEANAIHASTDEAEINKDTITVE